MVYEKQPFSYYVRLLGRGPGRSRSLTAPEAEDAFTQILTGEATEAQLGAYLMLQRMKGETADELAGMTRALQNTVVLPDNFPRVGMDWPSYAAGKSRKSPLFVMSALLLARAGVPVVMHGFNSHLGGAVKPEQAVRALGLPVSTTLDGVAESLRQHNFAYMPLENLSYKMFELIQYRDVFALRSCVNTLARMGNPFRADHILQGVFHPAYLEKQTGAARELGTPSLAVYKGGGGEAERNPSKPVKVWRIKQGEVEQVHFPPLMENGPKRLSDDIPVSEEDFIALWRGDIEHDFAAQVVIASLAVPLFVSGICTTTEAADEMAGALWRDRRVH